MRDLWCYPLSMLVYHRGGPEYTASPHNRCPQSKLSFDTEKTHFSDE